MMLPPTDKEHENAARKLAEGTWQVRTHQKVDLIEYFEIWDGDKKLAHESDFGDPLLMAMLEAR